MPVPTAIDLFAGAGGASEGLKSAGFDVIGAVENDPDAAASYALNHPSTTLWEQDIRKLRATTLVDGLGIATGQLTLLKACPPCQGFSSLAEGRITPDDARNDLVGHTIRFVRAFRPEFVLLENVPGLGRDERSARLARSLGSLGYATREYRVNAADLGVPQRRNRLIILAQRGLRSRLPETIEPMSTSTPTTVRQAFDALSKAKREDDPLDRHRSLTGKTAQRVAAIPIGGDRFDLPLDLQLDCHKRIDTRSRSATASYGRIKWDEAAPTMTTRCTTVACGTYIHPSENRGLTLREAATLQMFPPTYDFVGSYGQVERQIGNAVPVGMAETLGRQILGLRV